MKNLLQLTLSSAAAALLCLGGFALPMTVQAQPSIHIQIGNAPPPPRYEAAPAPRRGHVWAPGHWEWQRGRHVWVKGSWLKARPGYAYQAPQWRERDGRWVYQSGRWERARHASPRGHEAHRDRDRKSDRDGDGVPNRHDNRPNDPRRH